MFAPLEKVKIKSSYDGDLPDQLARCTPDMLAAIRQIAADLKVMRAQLVLSDLYRTYEMQLQAHLEYLTGKKRAYSPPPGGSMHEAGRAFDLELDEIRRITLATFWEVAERYGVAPIIDTPSSGKDEAWHFDCRGSHGRVYDYYRAGHGDNFGSPYRAMAASAIVSTGQKVDDLGEDPVPGYIQSGLIRLGQEIGDMDGRIGPRSRAGLEALAIDPAAPLDAIAEAVERRLQAAFPHEYFLQGANEVATLERAAPIMLSRGLSLPFLAPEPYTPASKNRARLGNVLNLLAEARRIERSFALQPRFVATLPGGQLYFDSELQLDTDGWPEGRGKGDSSWQPETSLRYERGRGSINSNTVPYMVLPHSAGWVTQLGIALGDYAAVLYRGEVSYAVFADGGPNNKIGEGSLQLLRELGEERIRGNGTVLNAGAGPDIVTIVFPGSGRVADRADEASLLGAIRTNGARLFNALAH